MLQMRQICLFESIKTAYQYEKVGADSKKSANTFKLGSTSAVSYLDLPVRRKAEME